MWAGTSCPQPAVKHPSVDLRTRSGLKLQALILIQVLMTSRPFLTKSTRTTPLGILVRENDYAIHLDLYNINILDKTWAVSRIPSFQTSVPSSTKAPPYSFHLIPRLLPTVQPQGPVPGPEHIIQVKMGPATGPHPLSTVAVRQQGLCRILGVSLGQPLLPLRPLSRMFKR